MKRQRTPANKRQKRKTYIGNLWTWTWNVVRTQIVCRLHLQFYFKYIFFRVLKSFQPHLYLNIYIISYNELRHIFFFGVPTYTKTNDRSLISVEYILNICSARKLTGWQIHDCPQSRRVTKFETIFYSDLLINLSKNKRNLFEPPLTTWFWSDIFNECGSIS